MSKYRNIEISKYLIVCTLLCFAGATFAADYIGRVVDESGAPVSYATVYMKDDPVVGTATASNGLFRISTDLPIFSELIVSFIGYEKQVLLLSELHDDTTVIVLKEQPLHLEEIVIAAKPQKQKNKRKRMQSLLAAVYEQMQADFPTANASYHIVSDVRMDAEDAPWGIEQMIAQVVVLPRPQTTYSVQFRGEYCKRFFDADKRAQADSILATDALERLEKNAKDKRMRRAVNAVDSGVVVHRALFAMGNIRYDFEQSMKDLGHWSVSNESEDETVLTHKQTVIRYLGCFQMTFRRHYILDSRTLSVKRFAEHADVKVTIPFGMKLNAEQLQLLNLLNMNEQKIQKFRLKRLQSSVDLNTIYQQRDDRLYILEKNMIMDARIEGAKKTVLPLHIKATQRVTELQTQDVNPLRPNQITRRVPREIVQLQ